MMFQKLFTASQIKEIDYQTTITQNISSLELMERAASKLFKQLIPYIAYKTPIFVFCGTGNNGGDGLVLTRLLFLKNYQVKCFIVGSPEKASNDFSINLKKLKQINFKVEYISTENLPKIPKNSIIIDAIFGTGLTRTVKGIAQKTIQLINQSKNIIYSIDLPSGLYADKSNSPKDSIVKSTKVFTFQFPKLSFFFPENIEYVPNYEVVDIGLDTSAISEMHTTYFLITEKIKDLLKKRPVYAHKNTFGHAYIVGGSYGMIGAPLLSSNAALRIGAGLVSNFLPRIGYSISQTFVPEVMSYSDVSKKYISKIKVPKHITAAGIGMGMQTKLKTQKAFKSFLNEIKVPLLLDADALNILSENKKWLSLIPPHTVLTPHEGEFKRLVGNWKNSFEKWQLLKEFSIKYNCITVLKGPYSVITNGSEIYINPIANSALATAGSGDVLSGIITGLLAQKTAPLKAAILGVYIHAKTAELYVKKHKSYSMIASDIIELLKF